MDFGQIAMTVSVWALPVLLAVTLHEAAHGWVAWKLGDQTAKDLGRVTFNPFRHIDPFGTVLLPAMLLFVSSGQFMFGFAKPVPVNPWNFRHPRRDMVWVAAAGPATNLALALAAAFAFHLMALLPAGFAEWVGFNLRNALVINLILAVFNMLPLPPLDGGRVAVGLLPLPLARRLAAVERYGIFIILGILFILPWIGREIGVPLDVFPWLIGAPVEWLIDVIVRLAGLG